MDKIFVTKPYLPPMEEYVDKISSIWDTHILTNFGPQMTNSESISNE